MWRLCVRAPAVLDLGTGYREDIFGVRTVDRSRDGSIAWSEYPVRYSAARCCRERLAPPPMKGVESSLPSDTLGFGVIARCSCLAIWGAGGDWLARNWSCLAV